MHTLLFFSYRVDTRRWISKKCRTGDPPAAPPPPGPPLHAERTQRPRAGCKPLIEDRRGRAQKVMVHWGVRGNLLKDTKPIKNTTRSGRRARHPKTTLPHRPPGPLAAAGLSGGRPRRPPVSGVANDCASVPMRTLPHYTLYPASLLLTNK